MGNQIIIIENSNAWIEGNAVQQLETTAKLPHIQRVAGMPDLHAGRGYPIGAAFFSVGHFYPALIGNDIGCGMAFWQTNLAAHKAKTGKLVKQLGSIDAPLGEDWQARINELLPQHPFQAALGTIGGGNHFAELQAVDTVYAPDSLPAAFNPQCLQLLVPVSYTHLTLPAPQRRNSVRLWLGGYPWFARRLQLSCAPDCG